jgi:hypothetical protein
MNTMNPMVPMNPIHPDWTSHARRSVALVGAEFLPRAGMVRPAKIRIDSGCAG